MAAVVLVLAGCGQTAAGPGDRAGGSDGPRSGPVDPALVDRTFLSTAVTEDGASRELVDGSRLELSFTRDAVGAYADCNHLGSRTRTSSGRLLVTAMDGTEMGCAGALLDQDDWIGDLLTLTAGDTTIELLDEEVASPDRELVGTDWVLDGFRPLGAPVGTVSSVPAGVRATLRIEGDRLLVELGCNGGGADVEVAEDTLALGPLGRTRMGCPGPGDRVERVTASALRGSVQYDIDVDVLTVTRGSHQLIYRMAGSPAGSGF